MTGLRRLLVGAILCGAIEVTTMTQGIPQADLFISNIVGRYGPTTVPTGDATANYARFQLGVFQAGTSVRIGTCGMTEASFERNTVLRLFAANTTTELASNDDSCAGRAVAGLGHLQIQNHRAADAAGRAVNLRDRRR